MEGFSGESAFDHVVRRAQLEHFSNCFLVIDGGKGNNGDLGVTHPQLPNHLGSTNLRQYQVDEHDIGRPRLYLGQRFFAVARRFHIVVTEQQLGGSEEALGVVGEKYPSFRQFLGSQSEVSPLQGGCRYSIGLWWG